MWKFKDKKCNNNNCGVRLVDIEPYGNIHKCPITSELLGYCPKCLFPQPVVEVKSAPVPKAQEPEPEPEPETPPEE